MAIIRETECHLYHELNPSHKAATSTLCQLALFHILLTENDFLENRLPFILGVSDDC